MKLSQSVVASAVLIVAATAASFVAPGGSAPSEAIGSSTRPYVLATPFFQPKSGTNNTLHITNMDDVAISFNTRRYGADGTLLSSSITTVQKKATVITFAGANLGAQMHVEVWAATPFFTVELFFTDASNATHKIEYAQMMKPRTGTGFLAVDPFRLCDTRISGTSCPQGGVGPNQEIVVGVAGLGGVPTVGTSAVTVNLIAINGTAASLLKIWPDGTPRPTATAITFEAGEKLSNMVTVKLGTNGKLRVANAAGTVNVVVELAGYFA